MLKSLPEFPSKTIGICERNIMGGCFNFKEDQFIRGIISGTIGGTLKDLPALILQYIFKNPNPTFWDYMSLLAIGRIPKSWDEYLLSIIVEVLWCIVLAIIFVYLQPKLSSKHYIMQGAGFGIFIWLIIRAVVYFLKATELIHSLPLTAVINGSISIFYGITVAIIDHKLKFSKKLN
jgi:hypothetical protein